MKSRPTTTMIILSAAGGALLAAYLVAWRLGDLRARTVEFEIVYFSAFAVYTLVTVLALREAAPSPASALPGGAQAHPNRDPIGLPFRRRHIVIVFVAAAAMMTPLLFTRPTLSDDMYRYVWDGRVQAIGNDSGGGLSPYRYAPNAPALRPLRDAEIWPNINRKSAVTVYPPGAELAFALLWRIWPDSVRGFQIAMGLGALVAGGLLLGLLRDLGRSPARVLIYLWSPLLIFETSHAAHVDGLVLPLLVGAWWARVRERDGLTGALLGLATAAKLYPVLLLPALWRPRKAGAWWRLPLGFLLTLALCYLPYVITSGLGVLGYLPNYFGERFNMGLAALLIPAFERLGFDPNLGALVLTLVTLAALGIAMLVRPAADGEAALRRCVWLMGAFTLLTQNLFSWYLLWLLPLVAIFLRPGRVVGLRLDSWTGWWLFCGLVGLSYTFFIDWRPAPWALWLQFAPLYALLITDAVRRLRRACAGSN